MIWFLVGLAANTIIGAAVWVSIDDKDQRYFKWYKEAPSDILKFLVLQLWMIGLIKHLRNKMS